VIDPGEGLAYLFWNWGIGGAFVAPNLESDDPEPKAKATEGELNRNLCHS